eukprot:scaffold2945_cov244-Pinguiococcus_pyrenoidosus.AAC.11
MSPSTLSSPLRRRRSPPARQRSSWSPSWTDPGPFADTSWPLLAPRSAPTQVVLACFMLSFKATRGGTSSTSDRMTGWTHLSPVEERLPRVYRKGAGRSAMHGGDGQLSGGVKLGDEPRPHFLGLAAMSKAAIPSESPREHARSTVRCAVGVLERQAMLPSAGHLLDPRRRLQRLLDAAPSWPLVHADEDLHGLKA